MGYVGFFIADGDIFDLGDREIEAIATPGHTHGSMTFLDHRTGGLFTGDMAYQGTLYAHFADSDLDEYIASLEKVIRRADQFGRIYPAHNDFPIPKTYLTSVLDGMLKIKKNEVQPMSINGWGEPACAFLMDDISILSKAPGSQGVRLIERLGISIPPMAGES